MCLNIKRNDSLDLKKREDEEIQKAAEILMSLRYPPKSESSYELRGRCVQKASSVHPKTFH